jgi:hypothetical protein
MYFGASEGKKFFVRTHNREDEDFFILEGEFEFSREGQEPLRGLAGDFVHTPKEVAHTFRNVRTTVGRLLTIAVPAGMDQFFAEAGQPADSAAELPPQSGRPTPEEIEHVIRIAQKHGIEIKLPPASAP